MGLGLEIKDIFKSYEGNNILEGLTHTFASGETHVIMGANGCGKSTLLRICALLEEADSGSLLFSSAETVLPFDLALRRRMTLVLPKVGAFNASVLSNIAYGLKIRDIERRERIERAEQMLAFIGLSHKRNQNALTLSSGEVQRLGIGRALVIEPDLLFLDEPTASVDTRNNELIVQMILEKKREAKTTIIMTTHDNAQAERLSDNVLRLSHGSLSY